MKKLKIGKSNIHGKGLFSGEPIKKGELIAKVHSGIQLDPERIKYMPTQYGRFYNHDEKNFNTRNEIINNHRYLRALKNIPANTELTANYREHPEMEQPENFGQGKYASFDFDKTIATDEGLAKARQMIRDGYNLFIISARGKVTPDMVARARKAGIPEENIIATGSDEAKVKKVKQLGVEMHFDDKPEVVSALGLVGQQFRKGGGVNSKRYTKSLTGTNKLFTKNNLFKKKSTKRIYDPNAKYFDNGGTINSPVQTEPYYDFGEINTPEEWQQSIRALEQQIGNPSKWTQESYDLMQNKLNDYKNWRTNTYEGQQVNKIDTNNPNEYTVPIPEHLLNKETEPICDDEGRCYETDQIQQYLDLGRDLPQRNVGLMWDVADEVNEMDGAYLGNAKAAWKSKGLPQTLGQRLGMTNPSNCMWAAGSGWQCLDETRDEFKNYPLSAFESNDKFISAVNKGTIPFTRITKTNEKNFDAQDKGLLQPGDIINIKGNGSSHAMTFSHYREDGKPIYLDSNGDVMDFDFNAGIWEGMKPGGKRYAYVSRFNPEMFYADEIKDLEEKARTNPTFYGVTADQTMLMPGYLNGGIMMNDISIPRLNQFNNGGSSESISGAAGSTTCQLGYAWDKAKGMCVPIPNFKEYFTNWFKDRELPFDEIDNKKYVAIAKQMLPKYNPESTLLEEIANFSDPEYKETIANDPNVMGQVRYDEDYNPVGVDLKSSLLGDVKELGAIGSHEYSSLASFPYADKLFPAQNLVIDPGLVLFEDRWGDLKGAERDAAEEHYNYVTDPEQDNIHSMIFEERYKRDLKPQQKITEEDINNWKTEAEASGAFDRNSPNFNDTLYTLFKLAKDNKALMDWFNKLASNDRPKSDDDPQYAKQGGSTGYKLGDEIDESTMRKLKKLGYTFQKV